MQTYVCILIYVYMKSLCSVYGPFFQKFSIISEMSLTLKTFLWENILTLWENIILIASIYIYRTITLPNEMWVIYFFFLRGRSQVEFH